VGDIRTAVRQPDSIVLSRRLARKYFGDRNPLGQTVELDRGHPLRVTAVVENVPANSHFNGDVFVSGLTSFSPLAQFDADPAASLLRGLGGEISLYVRLPPGFQPVILQNALSRVAKEVLDSVKASGWYLTLTAVPLAEVHLSPPAGSRKPRGQRTLLYSLALVGVLIVLVAGINFVVLMTARAGRRAAEIGVRKASGARFRDLAAQFIGESVVYCLVAMLLALALVELSLPLFNDFLQRDIAFGYSLHAGSDLGFLGALLALATLTGMGAGFYPAVVLSRFRPVTVLKGTGSLQVGGGQVRQILVVCQFAVLITLILATVVIYRQVQFALNEGMRLDKDQALTIQTSCVGPFVTEVRRLPGVRDVACSENFPVHMFSGSSGARAPTGSDITVFNVAVEPGFLELYGLRPIAGRFFSRAREGKLRIESPDDTFIGPVVINETAVRQLGYTSPQAAVGQALRHSPGPHQTRTDVSTIIGVAPDFPNSSVHEPVDPQVFNAGTGHFLLASVKLTGRQIPETLAGIDQLWKHLGEPKPIQRVFVDRYLQDQYAGDIKQGQMFAGFALVALFIACLGLFGLSAFTAERRTKEIGIRKAMGAGRGEMVRMLLWQFTRPVLWANLLAWPAGYFVMSRWLNSFAYRIDLAVWMFVVAGGVAISIAWLTVSLHAFAVARARPVEALRYE
jgi:putative ABC transport system permease protein